MNIKIKSTGVTCLVGDDYDRVYAALKKELNDSEEQLFTERIPGHEYLQWELPGEGWKSLSDGDPLMIQEVRQELLKRKKAISHKFGNNQDMAQRILSVPDDSYVYFKAGTDGRLLIRLTAWGYRYPERVGGGDTTGTHTPKGETESVFIHIFYDNKPLPNKELLINGFKRITDDTGVYKVGKLPIGYKFEVKVDDKQQIVVVQPGQGDIQIDITTFVTVEVRAFLDGQPYEGAVAFLAYWGHEFYLTLDAKGCAAAKVPKDPNFGECTVSLANEYQQQPLVQPITTFTFNANTPEEEKSIDDEIDVPYDKAEKEDDVLEETEQNIIPIEDKDAEEVDVGDGDTILKNNTEEAKDDKEKEDEQIELQQESQSPLVEKQDTPLIMQIISALSLLTLVVMTYLFCYGMLFG